MREAKQKNTNFGELNIEFVLQEDAPDAVRIGNANRAEVKTECPYCGHTKLYVNTQRDIFFCQHCQKKGGMLALHMQYTGIPDTKTALADLQARYDKLPEEERKARLQRKKEEIPVESKAANIDRRDACYRRLIAESVLSNADRANLIARGLSEEAIQKYGIVSTPVIRKTIAEKVIGLPEELDFRKACVAKYGSDIPGIYGENGDIYFVRLKAGMMIPVVNRNGKISMFQIRYQNPVLPSNPTEEEKKKYAETMKKFHKYAQLSSGYMPSGCSTAGLEKVHYVGFDFSNNRTPDTVCITEGCLKADVASFLQGDMPYLAILGVNNTNQLENEISYCIKNGTKYFRIRYDMDFMSNDAVAMAVYQTNLMLQSFGFESVIFKPYKPDEEWLSVYEAWKKVMNGQIGKTKKLPALNYKVVIKKGEMRPDKLYCINDIWKPSIGKGVDDYLHNR